MKGIRKMLVSPVNTEDIFMSEHPTVPFFKGVTPLPPSVNAAYKIIRSRRTQEQRVGPTKELEQFKQDAALLLSQAEIDWSLVNAVRASRRKTPLRVVARVYFSTEWRRDLDGVIKYAVDACFARMELDDRLVTTLVATKHVDPVQPRIEIEISFDLS